MGESSQFPKFIHMQQTNDDQGTVTWTIGKPFPMNSILVPTFTERASYTLLSTPPSLTFNVSNAVDSLWGWGALSNILRTSTFGSVRIDCNSTSEDGSLQTFTVHYACDSAQFLYDLMEHPQTISNYTRAAVLYNRVAKDATVAGLQLITIIEQSDLSIEQAIQFPLPCAFKSETNWKAYYALSIFSAWSELEHH